MGTDRNNSCSEARKTRLRHFVHVAFAVVLLAVILIFQAAGSPAVIALVLKLANYTYGPLLGLFAFGLFCKERVRDRYVPVVCLASPVICYLLGENSQAWLGGYQFGNELLIVNGLLTCAGLWSLRDHRNP